MHRSWQHLIIQNETELQDLARIRKLAHADTRSNMLVGGAFLAGGIISVLLAIFLSIQSLQFEEKQLSFILTSFALLVMGVAFFIGAKLFYQEIKLNPLRSYLKNPQDFLFIKGSIEDCYYLSGQKRHQDVIVAEGTASGPQGERLQVREEFSPRTWNFTTPEAERSLQKGADWYEMKGQRRLLPVPAYFICNKTGAKYPSLIAIEKEYVSSQ